MFIALFSYCQANAAPYEGSFSDQDLQQEGGFISWTNSAGKNSPLFYSSMDASNVYLLNDRISITQELVVNEKREGHRTDIVFKNSAGSNDVQAKAPTGYKEMRYGNNATEGFKEQYRELSVTDFYEDIDLQVFHEGQSIKYELVAEPGADIDDIAFEFKGDGELTKKKDGSLIYEHNYGKVHELAPYSYQMIDGEEKEVEVSYEVDGNTVRFDHGNYEENETLYIDPELIFSTYIGGEEIDKVHDGTTDDQGNIYVTGKTRSTHDLFPVTEGDFQEELSAAGKYDAFVAKFNQQGQKQWATYFGGKQDDIGHGIQWAEEDELGGVIYFTGETKSNEDADEFPVNFYGTDNPYQDELNTDKAGFLAKFTESGDYEWATYITSDSPDEGEEVAGYDVSYRSISSEVLPDRPLVVGYTTSDDMDFQTGHRTTYPGTVAKTGFAVSIEKDGESKGWGTYVGGENGETVLTAVDMHDNHNWVMTGYTESDNLMVTDEEGEVIQSTLAGTRDALIAQINRGGILNYKSYIGGNDKDEGHDIVSDDEQETYITGWTESEDFLVENAWQETLSGSRDAFLMQLDEEINNGNVERNIVWSTFYGGTNSDEGLGVAVDEHAVYATGYTESSDFPLTEPAYDDDPNPRDAYMLQMKTGVGERTNATLFGGKNDETAMTVNVTNCGIYLGGFTNSSESDDFPLKDALQDEQLGGNSGFIAKMVPTLKAFDTDGPYTTLSQELNITMELYIPDAILQYYTETDVNDGQSSGWFHNGSPTGVYDDELTLSPVSELSGNYTFNAAPTCNKDTMVNSLSFELYVECNWPTLDNNYGFDYHIDQGEFPLNSYHDDKLFIEGTVVVNDEVEITDSELFMADCAEIIVEEGARRGGELNLHNTLVHGCGDWKGIKVQGNPNDANRQLPMPHGYLSVQEGTRIQDADVAVYSHEGGFVNIQNSEFSYNNVHLAIDNYNYSHDPILDDNEFYSLKPEPYICDEGEYDFPVYNNRKMVHIEKVKDISFENNHLEHMVNNKHAISLDGFEVILSESINAFNNKFFSNMSRGIKYIQVENGNGYQINENYFNGNFLIAIDHRESNATYIQQNTLETIGEIGIRATHNIPGSNSVPGCIDFNTIGIDKGNLNTGILIEHSEFHSIDDNNIYGYNDNSINEGKSGLYVLDTYIETTVSNNNIEGWNSAIEIYLNDDYSLNPFTINENHLSSNMFGLVIAQEEHPHYCDGSCNNDYSYDLNIEIFCNEIFHNDVGIFGSGNLIDQNMNNSPGIDVTSNAWWDPNIHSESTQKDWDILWENGDNDVLYIYSDFENKTEPNATGLTFNDYYVNGDPFYPSSSGGDPDIDHDGIEENGCWSEQSLKDSQTSIENVNQNKKEITIYPNPFSYKVNIEVEGDQIIRKVALSDMSGRTVIEEPIDMNTEATINTKELHHGVYFLNVITEKGNTYQMKLIRE